MVAPAGRLEVEPVNRLRGNPWAVLITLCLGFFMTLLDTTVVGVAMPNIIASLGLSYSEVLWVSNAYVLVLAVLLITAGRLGDLLGKRNVYLAGVAVFTVASVCCALSQNAGELIAARAVQGLGAALLMPQTMSIIVAIFPPDRRGTALGVWGAVAGVATVAGPPLGGFLVNAADWRWIFTINVPLGLLVLALAPLIIPVTARPPRAGRFDVRGAVLITVALALLAFAVQEGQRYHWGTVWSFVSIPLLLVLGAVVFAGFALSQSRPGDRTPMVPIPLLRNRNFALMSVSAIGLSIGLMSMAIGFQLYAQSVLGYSALAAGMISAPLSVVSAVVGPIMGRLSDRFSGRRIAAAGLALFAVGLVIFALTSRVDSSVWALVPGLVVMGAGLGCVFAPLAAVAMHDVPPVMAGAAAGVMNATRQLGSVLGTAGFGVLLQYELTNNLMGVRESTVSTLPPEARADFVNGIHGAAANGIDYAALQTGTAVRLPPDATPELAQQISVVARQVFGDGFVSSMHIALCLPIVALLAAAGCALLTRERTPAPSEPERESVRTA
ncbi:DHA2 family efflux MFS transporter permease subunit [Nocardia arthritidis]|uniref:DHA2 family efflux MFS transporter permease subunit n=1 Tax=Nocardia arthritidis TaxID=228602 RepID=A0A6G9YP56_9NOCA|nr:DHA2 family efflux MFS transporter permease subunit [Nocardia arthritidis]